MNGQPRDVEIEHEILNALRREEIDARRREEARLSAERDRWVTRRRRQLARRQAELARCVRGEVKPEELLQRQARIAREDARFARSEELWRSARAALRSRAEAEDALWRETRIRVIGATVSPAYTSRLPS